MLLIDFPFCYLCEKFYLDIVEENWGVYVARILEVCVSEVFHLWSADSVKKISVSILFLYSVHQSFLLSITNLEHNSTVLWKVWL